MCSKWRGFWGVFTLAVCLGALGCGSDGNTFVRVVNASQGLSVYSVQVGQTGIASGVPFGTEGVQQPGQYSTIDASGNYRPVGAGAKQPLIIYSTPGNTLSSATQDFLRNARYTIVVESPAPNIQSQTLTDDNTPPSSGNYKLRVMDTSVEAGNVDVYVTALGAGLSGSPTVANMQFQQVTTPYLELAPGTLEIQVTRHGSNTVLASEAFSPASGGIYSVFFLDPTSHGGSNYGILIVNDPVVQTAAKK